MTSHPARREFLGTAAAVAAWSRLRASPFGGAGTEPAARGALKLGLASYSMREFPLDQALAWAKTVGVTSMTSGASPRAVVPTGNRSDGPVAPGEGPG